MDNLFDQRFIEWLGTIHDRPDQMPLYQRDDKQGAFYAGALQALLLIADGHEPEVRKALYRYLNRIERR